MGVQCKIYVLKEETCIEKILSVIVLGVAIFTIAFTRPALAADTANGAKIF